MDCSRRASLCTCAIRTSRGAWGFCPWLVLTGTYCPGCGGLRAVNDLTNGDVRAAFASNALFVALVPAIAVMWTRSVVSVLAVG